MVRRNRSGPGDKRPLTESEVFSLQLAVDKRTGPRDRSQIIAQIKAKNSYRWWRIQYDYRWLRKQMRKMGYNPDEAKDLL